ncbi:alpha/beta hydrolase [Actinomadura craniellae]|uniref:Alpha/beta hydrolase n=1 Tax=Actinomadura craniellae TaxID=2231787 RepID=A0A365H7T9_9ACTN|nr:alpha/beta hydrolase [Actinomadura craniellae]RAY15109.1 alpha/beta hydrolase [Actinomadura craniellae]
MGEQRPRRRPGWVGVAGTVAGLGAAGIGTAVGVRRFVVGRERFRPDHDASEPFGELRGRPLTVPADDGLPLYVEVDGPDDAALTVLFCHGYTLNQDSWHYQRRDLAGTGARLVFWDQRSHGRSGRGNPTRATIDQLGSDLYEVLRATVPAGSSVVLVGHSMGGMAIMALAELRPELFGDQVVGVALINTSCGNLAEMTLGLPILLAKLVRPLAPGVVRGLGRRPELVDRTRHLGADLAFMVTRRMAFADKYVSPTVVGFLEEMIRSTPIDVIAEFYPSLMAHDKRLALDPIARVPAVVLVGGRDRLTPPEHGRAIAAALPNAEVIEVVEAGHVLPLEHPGVVTGALRRLITRSRSRPRNRKRPA